jgi:hypothetical protein
MNEIKIDKSKNYCHLGNKEDSFNAVISIIPENAIDEMTSKSLGKLIDAIWKSWTETKKIHDADIVSEGAVWDEKTQRLIELCQN